MAGRKVFTSGEILTAADVNSYLMDQSVMVFADSTARSSAIPSPTEGMVTYLEDADELEVYTNSWGAVSTPGVLQVISTTKTNTFSTTSTSYTNVTGLSATITPSSTSSKIMIMSSTALSASTANLMELVLDRDGTNVSVSSTGTTSLYAPRSEFGIDELTSFFLDSPATTSSVTYQIKMKVSAGTGFVNRRGASATPVSTSSITVMEVAV